MTFWSVKSWYKFKKQSSVSQLPCMSSSLWYWVYRMSSSFRITFWFSEEKAFSLPRQDHCRTWAFGNLQTRNKMFYAVSEGIFNKSLLMINIIRNEKLDLLLFMCNVTIGTIVFSFSPSGIESFTHKNHPGRDTTEYLWHA